MKNYLKNSKGLTLIELMIAMFIGLIVLAGTIQVFTYQADLIKDENDNTKVRSKGRHAIKILAREVRMAGFGLPKHQGLDSVAMGAFPTASPPEVDSISFRTNRDFNGDLARAYGDPGGGDITDVSASVQVIALDPNISFQTGDDIVIFNPGKVNSSGQYIHEATVDSAASEGDVSINFSPSLPTGKAITYSPNANLVMVNRFIKYTLGLTGNQITRTIGGTATTLVNDVETTGNNGLVFRLLQDSGTDATDYDEVERITIILNMIDPNNPDATIEFSTDVQLRNS